MQTQSVPTLIAVDIGNSRIKLGRFENSSRVTAAGVRDATSGRVLPEPATTMELPLAHATGEFDADKLRSWCEKLARDRTRWMVASVHRAAAQRLMAVVEDWAERTGVVQHLTYRDVPMEIRVEEPARVGIDRVLAAFAAGHLREHDRPAVIVDLGTAITVDLLEADGAFGGGAILPGIAMAARALHEQTDALPLVDLEHVDVAPTPLGKSTTDAMKSGLFWGTIGAIDNLISGYAALGSKPPDVFVTGGASAAIARVLASSQRLKVRHEPHLVLTGIALVAGMTDER